MQDEATAEGEIKLAESDLARAEDRVEWAQRMFDKGYVSVGKGFRRSRASEGPVLQRAGHEQAERASAIHQAQDDQGARERRRESSLGRTGQAGHMGARTRQGAEARAADFQMRPQAPSDGLVVYANDPGRGFGATAPQVEEGATVRERQKIFSLPDITKMQVNTKVHESQIDKVATKMQAKIRVESFADQVLSGTVLDVARCPTRRTFLARTSRFTRPR